MVWNVRAKKLSLTTEKFIERSKIIHNNEYDYSQTIYKNASTKVDILCQQHGIFKQLPFAHLSGQGCPYCAGKNITTEDFIKKAKLIHDEKYDYSKVNYVNNNTKVSIICAKHGEFLQSPSKHLIGQGCPKCNSSHLENDMREFLTLNDINFIEQYNFNGLLKRQTVDFYLPDYNIAIECQGIQHFEPTYSKKNFEKSHKEFNKILKRDYKKYNKLIQLNLTVIYFIYKNIKKYIVNNDLFNNIYSINNVILDKNEILNKLKREE